MSRLPELLDSLEAGARAGSSPEGSRAIPEHWLEQARRVNWKELPQSARESARPSEGPRSAETGSLAAARSRRLALRDSEDVSTLLATLKGGTLLEQRAALAALTTLARTSGMPAIGSDGQYFDPELEWDLLHWQAEGNGAPAREARASLTEVSSLLDRVEERVRSVVDGHDSTDPLSALEPHEQAQLYLHLRSASTFVTSYLIDGLLEGLERGDERETSRRLVAWRAAADPRLLPTLTSIVLDSPDSAVRAEAARALARIDDARVAAVLQLAYQTASAREERIALIEAFGMQGEVRDSQFLRESLEAYQRETPTQLPRDDSPPSSRARGHLGLATALDAIFDVDLVETAVRLVAQPHAEVQRAAIRAVGRVGEHNALGWLDRLHESVPAGLHGELAAAEASILGRAELRGERPETLLDARHRAARERALARKFSRGLDVPPTRRHRFLAWLLLLRAFVASWFGARETTSELCDAAYQADPSWYLPPWVQGRLWRRAGDLARAVGGYRRALALAPRHLLRRTRWITPIVQCFVLHAENLLQGGHSVRAQRLLDELWPHDLSRSAPPVRLALRRCRQHLALTTSARLAEPAWAGDTGPGRDTLERIGASEGQ